MNQDFPDDPGTAPLESLPTLLREPPWLRKQRRPPLPTSGLDILAAIGSDTALMHLNGIAAKAKFQALQARAREKIQAVAALRGFTADQLADRLVPDLGLDDRGSLLLDFGPRQFHVAFDETLRPFVKDSHGTRLKGLPKPLQSDVASQADAATERYGQLKKEAKTIAMLQVIRLELCMVTRRRWTRTEFDTFLLGHPLLRHLTTRLVWGVYSGPTLRSAFRVAEDWTFADHCDALYPLAQDASIGIAHVLELPTELHTAFGQIFADYEIVQPFKQLGREVHAATAAELQATSITRFEHKWVASGNVIGLVNRGWHRGRVEDDAMITEMRKRLGEHEVVLQLDPGMLVGEPSHEPKQRLPALHLRSRDQGSVRSVQFAQLDAISLSEVLRDIELLAAIE